MLICKHMSKHLKCSLFLREAIDGTQWYDKCPFTTGNRESYCEMFCKKYEPVECDLWTLEEPRISTADLADELVRREGVDDYPVYFNEQFRIHPVHETCSYAIVNGPAKIFVVYE